VNKKLLIWIVTCAIVLVICLVLSLCQYAWTEGYIAGLRRAADKFNTIK
jgi:hypothetical protein